MTLIRAGRRAPERQSFVALCLAAEKRALVVELEAAERQLSVVRVVRRDAGRKTSVKLVEATIDARGVDGAAADCLVILTRERRP